MGITSTIEGHTEIALGTVIGANILDSTLMIGFITLLARGIRSKNTLTVGDTFYVFGIMAAPMLLLLDHRLDRLDGVILLAVFLWYSMHLIKKEQNAGNGSGNGITLEQFVHSILLFVSSIILLFISAYLVIKSSTAISAEMNIPAILIGLFLVAFGTTLPELAFGTRAVLMGHGDMAIGDNIGSLVVNSTLVLGVTVLIMPIAIADESFLLFITSAFFMLTAGFIFLTFLNSDDGLTWQKA